MHTPLGGAAFPFRPGNVRYSMERAAIWTHTFCNSVLNGPTQTLRGHDVAKQDLMSLLGIEVPIVQAPMVLQKSLVPLAAAVSKAGGLGSLGCAEMSVSELDAHIRAMRAKTRKPFNLNFFLHKPPLYDQE